MKFILPKKRRRRRERKGKEKEWLLHCYIAETSEVMVKRRIKCKFMKELKS